MRDNTKTWTQRICMPLATGFGLGYSPFASGTAGTLLGVVIALSFVWMAPIAQIALAAALACLAVPICDVAEKSFGRKDDGRIVADEYMTFPICMIGLPVHPAVLALAFVTNRVFDIAKPPPARRLQRVRGGLGIVIDDVFAALYALAVNHAVYHLILYRWLAG